MKQLHKMQNAVHNINPLWHKILKQILHTFLYAFPKMLTRRIYHTHNQGHLGFAIISFILITFMFDSGVIMLGEIRCQSLLRAKGFALDLGVCFLSHIQNQGYIQNSLFFCFSGLLESYRFCSKFKDFQSIMFRKIQLTAKIRLQPQVIYSFKWYFARCVFNNSNSCVFGLCCTVLNVTLGKFLMSLLFVLKKICMCRRTTFITQ